jgi:hypothetical protein
VGWWVGLAFAVGVQSRYSPYAAMGNNPAILVDPDGLKFAYPVLLTGRAEHSRVIAAMEAEVEYKQNGRLNDMSRLLSVGGMDWGGGRSNFVRMGVLEQFAMAVLAAGGQVLVATGNAGVDRNDNSGGVGNSEGGDEKDENGYSKKSTLYTTPNGEGTHTVEEWADHYNGKSWKDIVTDNKGEDGDGYQRIKILGITVLKAPLGPAVEWRYVKMDDGRVLDMRHVLVVGMKSEFLGAAGEYVQYIRDKRSANSVQDFVSNAAGAQFLKYLQSNAPYYNPRHSTTEFGNTHQTNISQYFYKFIYGL